MSTKVWGVLSVSGLLLATAAQASSQQRVTGLYTTWDEYYFYAGFQVSDPDVTGTNTTPISQPQQDDDIEVFFETDKARAHVRTLHTYQMAVSAAGGAYFSIGDGSPIPKAKVVYTYKYAAGIDGTLNDNTDRDVGYTIEIAIPWQELGESGPPADGTTWGFNVISRDRHSAAKPATAFVSLSPNVQSEADIQNPSKWTTILFDAGARSRPKPTADLVVSPHVTQHFPLINGSIVSGEWPSTGELSFGSAEIQGNAPTVAEEPNTTVSPFSTPPPDNPQPPVNTEPPAAPKPPKHDTTVAKLPNDTGSIPLPGGGAIKIVPGGIKTPAGLEPPDQDNGLGPKRNPLSPKLPANYEPRSPGVNLAGNLNLEQPAAPSLIMAVYRIDYNADGRKGVSQNVWDQSGKSLLVDQPIDGAGPWFSSLRTAWHVRQLAGMRQAGIDVALVKARANDPLLDRELDALVAALKQLDASGKDYPLIGVDDSDDSYATVGQTLARIPPQFLARLPGEPDQGSGIARAVAYYGSRPKPSDMKPLPDGSAVAALTDDDSVALVTPGGMTASGLVDRNDGSAFADSWQKAATQNAHFIVLDSWNDFTHGTEIAPTRQYGEYFPDQERLHAVQFNGDRQWHAKYLSENVPRTIRPKTLYQIPIRIENAGTLPWRAGESYSLCVRWYKDGRLYDDSAPRIPIGHDVVPGQADTVSIGLVALNSYGTDLEPGDYTLVFDMVQGNDRWFSYAGDAPLQVPVKVVAADDATPPHATFLDSTTPTTAPLGIDIPTRIMVRNDGGQPWTPDSAALVCKIQTVDPSTGALRMVSETAGTPLGTAPVLPGQAAVVDTAIKLAGANGAPVPAGQYRLHWYVKPVKQAGPPLGVYDEEIAGVDDTIAPSFILSDIDRTVTAGKQATARLAVENDGPNTWRKGDVVVGYHWYYLDGAEADWDGNPATSLTKDVPPGRADGDIVAKFRAPKNPGRYMLVWDVRRSDGKWVSTTGLADGTQILPALITVTGSGDVATPDLTSLADTRGISDAGDATGNFDGSGGALPDEILPPDGTMEFGINPLFQPKPSAPLYPSGYYAEQDTTERQHDIPFLYPSRHRTDNDTVTCRGQRIAIPGGDYRSVRILAASTDAGGTQAAFSVQNGGKSVANQDVRIANWLTAPDRIGVCAPYHRVKGEAVSGACYLGDYEISLGGSRRIDSLVLPQAPGIKILAVTAVK